MSQKKVNGILLGAIIGSVAGTLGSLFLPKQETDLSSGWAQKAKDAGFSVLEELKALKKEKNPPSTGLFLKGILLGIIVGSGSSLLFSPKSGRQIRKDLTQKYQDVSEKTNDIIEFIQENINHHPAIKAVREKTKPVHVKSTLKTRRPLVKKEKVHRNHHHHN